MDFANNQLWMLNPSMQNGPLEAGRRSNVWLWYHPALGISFSCSRSQVRSRQLPPVLFQSALIAAMLAALYRTIFHARSAFVRFFRATNSEIRFDSSEYPPLVVKVSDCSNIVLLVLHRSEFCKMRQSLEIDNFWLSPYSKRLFHKICHEIEIRRVGNTGN